jgi:hypothetical protein
MMRDQEPDNQCQNWKHRYIYTNLHEVLFVEFPCLLYEWLKRKTTINTTLGVQEPLVWDQTIINRLKYMDNKWAREIKFWFNQVKEGYIIEFTIEYNDSFSEDERKFVKGPRKRLLEEIPMWIKMLFVEKGLMHMEPDRMAE